MLSLITLQNFGEPLICDRPIVSAPRSSERFLDAVCAAKHTASIKPSLFGNRTDMDPQYVIFSSADEWLPLFQDRINLKKIVQNSFR